MQKSTFNLTISILVLTLLISLSGCERIAPTLLPETGETATPPLTVMTYNVYLGSLTEGVLGVENLLQVPTEVANIYNTFIASDFPGRATAIAKSIKTHRPHLIGLQEMSLIRQQIPGDRITGGSLPAEEVVMDFRSVLMDALKAEGLDYRIAAQVENIDVEMPMFADAGIVDVRLTDYDVILARSDVETSEPATATYANAFAVEKLGLEVKRGYVAVDASVNGSPYRFVNTHLESFDPDIRLKQAQELVESLSDETLPIIMVGDFNTAAPDGEAYQRLLAADYEDVWQVAAGVGNTCCQDPDLRNAESRHFKRIDQIFVCNFGERVYTATTQTVGDQPSDRLETGLWPSDHAGVVAKIVFAHAN